MMRIPASRSELAHLPLGCAQRPAQWLYLAAAATLTLVWAARADAQGQAQPGIHVNGTGEVRAKPDVVELNVTISAKAELSDDALVKFRSARKTTMDSLKGLKIPRLSIHPGGLTISAAMSQAAIQAMAQGENAPAGQRPQLQVSSPLKLTLSGIRELPAEEIVKTLGRVLDVTHDSGAQVMPGVEHAVYQQMGYATGQPAAMVRFVVSDLKAFREQAYEKAVADARSRAERLSKLTGVKLGRVVSVSESSQITSDDSDMVTAEAIYSMAVNQITANGGSTDEIPVRVKLSVMFSIDNSP